MLDSRSSGILLHPTSLPSPYGIGDLGDGAYRFVDFLQSSDQKIWQILPLGPTGAGNSPYSSYSAVSLPRTTFSASSTSTYEILIYSHPYYAAHSTATTDLSSSQIPYSKDTPH